MCIIALPLQKSNRIAVTSMKTDAELPTLPRGHNNLLISDLLQVDSCPLRYRTGKRRNRNLSCEFAKREQAQIVAWTFADEEASAVPY